MKNRDLIGSLFWFAVGCLFCVTAFKYRLFRAGIPGAGFFPFVAGGILAVLSFVVLISSIHVRRRNHGTTAGKFFPQQDSWKKVLCALGALLAYWIALEHLGFLMTTFLFMVFLLRFIEPQKWTVTLSTAFLATTLSYALFNVWLKVQLPKSILGM